jgi:hypothetical protein
VVVVAVLGRGDGVRPPKLDLMSASPAPLNRVGRELEPPLGERCASSGEELCTPLERRRQSLI